MLILGLDPEDGSLRETPERVANMYVREIFMV
jgi:GTP cyclohydrolase I